MPLGQLHAEALKRAPLVGDVVVHEAHRVDFDTEEETQALGGTTTGVEAFAVEREQFFRRSNLLVEDQLEHNRSSVFLGAGVVRVDQKLGVLDGEVDPVVLGVVPEVGAGKADQAQHAQEESLAGTHTVFIADALVSDNDNGQFRELLQRFDGDAQELVGTVTGDHCSNLGDNLGGEAFGAEVVLCHFLSGFGMVVDADGAADVVQEGASRNDHQASFVAEAIGEALVQFVGQVAGGVENGEGVPDIVFGLRAGELVALVVESQNFGVGQHLFDVIDHLWEAQRVFVIGHDAPKR